MKKEKRVLLGNTLNPKPQRVLLGKLGSPYHGLASAMKSRKGMNFLSALRRFRV